MNKTESDPHSINSNNIVIDLLFDSPLWQAGDFDLKDFINEIVTYSLRSLGLLALGKKIELSIVLADDEKIRELNKQYRDKDKATNVLSFPHYELTRQTYLQTFSEQKEIYLGDIMLSYTTIYNESIEQDKFFQHHLAHMLIHSILHLIGYNHEIDSEADKMEALEIKILEEMRIPNPY